MAGEKAIAIHRAWEKWPDVDVELVADLVAHGWDARASQPVRVEVTDDMVERAHSARLNFKSTRSPNNSRNAMRSAPESALGGGE